MRSLSVLLVLALGCPGKGQGDETADTGLATDRDEDGWGERLDCNDRDAAINPDAEEVCDGLDNDCDGGVDEDLLVDVWADTDGDGYGDPDTPGQACRAGKGMVANDDDCADTSARINPDALETCNGMDDDCDGDVDEDPVDGDTWFADQDGDGFGDVGNPMVACSPPGGSSVDHSDCHDDDATAYPGSTAWEWPEDGVDQDCDGFDGTRDLNGDGLTDLVLLSYRDEDGWQQQCPIYFGTADGYSEDTAAWLDTQAAAGAVAEDLDGDGRVDLVIPSYYDDAGYSLDSHVYWGTAGGPTADERLSLPTEGALTTTTADLDHDGFSELIFGCHYSDNGGYGCSSRVYWSDGGNWSSDDYLDLATAGTYHLAAEDLNGDGWTDLVFSSRYDGTSYASESSVFLNDQGSLDAEAPVLLPCTGATDSATADLNGDGWDDLAFASFYDGTSFEQDSPIYWGSAAGFDAADVTSLPTDGAWELEVADLNADGWTDLVVVQYRDDSTLQVDSVIWWGSAGGLSSDRTTGLPTQGARDAEVADLDHDGWLDLVFANYYGEGGYETSSYLYWGSAHGYSEHDRSELTTKGAFRVEASDVDHDGWPDLLFSSLYSGTAYSTEAYLYYGSSGGFSEKHRDVLPVVGAWGRPLAVGGR